DFGSRLGRLAYLEATGRPELAPLHVWAMAINQLYLANRISPDVGANLVRTMEAAGYRCLRSEWSECRSDALMIENILMFYDEISERLQKLGILSGAVVERQQQLIRAINHDYILVDGSSTSYDGVDDIAVQCTQHITE